MDCPRHCWSRRNPGRPIMHAMRLRRMDMLLVTALFGLATALPLPAPAMESSPPSAGAPPSGGGQQGTTAPRKKKTKATSGQKQQRSEREFKEQFWTAYNLIY